MFVVGEIRRRSIENSLSFALASTLVPEGVSALGEIGRDLLRALRLLFQNESLSGSPPVITAEHRELLFGSIRQYFDDYQDGEYVLLGFGVDSVEVVNRGFANMPVHLPGPQTAGGEVADVPRSLLEVKVRVLLASERALSSQTSEEARSVEALLAFYLEPVINIGILRNRNDHDSNLVGIAFRPVVRGSGPYWDRPMVVSLVSRTSLDEARQLPMWSESALNEIDLTAVISGIPAFSEKIRAAVAGLEPIVVDFDRAIPRIPGIDPVMANAGLRLIDDTIVVMAQFEDREQFFLGTLPGASSPDDAATRVQQVWDEFYRGPRPSWRGLEGATASVGVPFDELVTTLRDHLPRVLSRSLSGVAVLGAWLRVDAASVRGEAATGELSIGLNCTLPNYGAGVDLRMALQVSIRVGEQILDGERIVQVVVEVAGAINISDLVGVTIAGGLPRLVMAAAEGCSHAPSDVDVLTGALGGLAQVAAWIGYPFVVAALESMESFLNVMVAKSVVSALMRALAGTDRCADTPSGWITLGDLGSVRGEANSITIRLRSEHGLRSLADALSAEFASSSLFRPLAPVTLTSEIRAGSIALGLTTSHARDGQDIIREAAAGRLLIAHSSQFVYRNSCDENLVYRVTVTNTTPLAIAVSEPLIVGTSALSQAMARGPGWIETSGSGSRRGGYFDRIAEPGGDSPRRHWIVAPMGRIEFTFGISNEVARTIVAQAAQEQSLRYVLLTSVGVFPMERTDPLGMFALIDTEEGRSARYNQCVVDLMGRLSAAPVRGAQSARDLVDQFRRERIESRYVFGAGGAFGGAPGLLPLPGGDGFPTPVNPQVAAWATAPPVAGLDAGPEVFARLVRSVTSSK